MKIYFMVAVLSITWSGCNDSAAPDNPPPSIQEHIDHEEHPAPALELNDGKKWEANKETTEGIGRMTAFVNEYGGVVESQDCQVLRKKLEAEFNLIVQNCTMTGEAHNQFHYYLLPMKRMMADLDGGDKEACLNSIAILKRHLSEYENYFH